MFNTFRITLNIGSEIGSALESVEVIPVLCDFKATYSTNFSLSQNCPAQLQITDYNYNLHFQSILDLFVNKSSSSPVVILHRSHKYGLTILHLKCYDLVIFYQCITPLLARLCSYGLSVQKGLHELGYIVDGCTKEFFVTSVYISRTTFTPVTLTG